MGRAGGVLVAPGVVLATESFGEGGVPVVVVHGYTGGVHEWRALAADLASERHVLLYDQRGHGASSAPRDERAYAIATLARDLEALLDAHAIARAHVLGHSMGGMVALHFALTCPSRVASLVLVATSARARRDAPRSLRERLLDGAPLARRAIDAVRRRVGRVDPPPSHVAQIAYRSLWRAMAEQEETLPFLRTLRMPTTVIAGDADDRFAPACAEIAEAIPDARAVTLAGVGHEPMRESPDALLVAIRAHLADG